jgi:hypothetical protein
MACLRCGRVDVGVGVKECAECRVIREETETICGVYQRVLMSGEGFKVLADMLTDLMFFDEGDPTEKTAWLRGYAGVLLRKCGVLGDPLIFVRQFSKQLKGRL